jgi:hypothetical protein
MLHSNRAGGHPVKHFPSLPEGVGAVGRQFGSGLSEPGEVRIRTLGTVLLGQPSEMWGQFRTTNKREKKWLK